MKSAEIKLGASVSIKAARPFGQDCVDIIDWCAQDLGIRRFRLMSYWDEAEPQKGNFDFSQIDRQLAAAAKNDSEVTFCLGVRQPRWPESHRPEWAKGMPPLQLKESAMNFTQEVLSRVDQNPSIVSYQLENEALNRGIGHGHDFSRQRLKSEFELVKSLADKPVIMTSTNSWGLPMLGPIPDKFAVSIYPYQWTKKGISRSKLPAWSIRSRARIIKLSWGIDTFCHELQAEPWGPKGNDQLTIDQQMELMSGQQITSNIEFAVRAGMQTIDLWGSEWWMYAREQGESGPANAVREMTRLLS